MTKKLIDQKSIIHYYTDKDHRLKNVCTWCPNKNRFSAVHHWFILVARHVTLHGRSNILLKTIKTVKKLYDNIPQNAFRAQKLQGLIFRLFLYYSTSVQVRLNWVLVSFAGLAHHGYRSRRVMVTCWGNHMKKV